MAPEDYYKDINTVYSLLNVELIEMEFGYSLIPLVEESSGGNSSTVLLYSVGNLHRKWGLSYHLFGCVIVLV